MRTVFTSCLLEGETMKKILAILLIGVSLISCVANIKMTQVEDDLIRNTFNENEYATGYIIDKNDDSYLVVGELVIDSNNQNLNATWLKYDEDNIRFNDFEIGNKVKYSITGIKSTTGNEMISSGVGLVLTTYPGIAFLEAIEKVNDNYSSIHESTEVIQLVVEIFEKENKRDEYSLFCINNIALKDNIWEITLIVDSTRKDVLQDYKVYIDDTSLEVIRVEHFTGKIK